MSSRLRLARCEVLVSDDDLKEIDIRYADTYALWIQKPITYDEILNGTPDYLISTKSELGRPVVGTPLILLAEAKKNDFEQGWGQCLAELVAAQKINNDPEFPVYAVVSDALSRHIAPCLSADVFTPEKHLLFSHGYLAYALWPAIKMLYLGVHCGLHTKLKEGEFLNYRNDIGRNLHAVDCFCLDLCFWILTMIKVVHAGLPGRETF